MIDRRNFFTALIYSLVAVLLVQVSTARIQFSTGDEGWLWYGFQRTLAGEWPLRDFNSYDPGRYLLLAAWGRLWGSDCIVVMRYGLAVIQWMALFPALLLICMAIPRRIHPICVLLLAVMLALWMAPRHKLIDIGATVWMTYVIAALFAEPSRWRYRAAGFVAALFWLIGRNHLLYGTLSIACTCAWLGSRSDLRRRWQPFVWGAEGSAGLLPMILLLCSVHGYAAAYWHNAILRLIEIGSTNLPLPVPWPWRTPLRSLNWTSVQQAAVGFGFLLLPATALITLFVFWRRKDSTQNYPVLIAAAITSIAWAHQAFSRADLPHLAQASLPLAILLLVVPWAVSGRIRPWAIVCSWGLFFAITFLVMIQLNPAYQALVQPGGQFVWENIHGERLYVPASTAADYRVAQAVVQGAGQGANILFSPYAPGLYPVFRLRCPVFDAYQLYPKTAQEQRESIEALKQRGVAWAVVWPYRMDGRADLGFAHTDSIVWDFIIKHFRVENIPVPVGDAIVLHRSSLDAEPVEVATVPNKQ